MKDVVFVIDVRNKKWTGEKRHLLQKLICAVVEAQIGNIVVFCSRNEAIEQVVENAYAATHICYAKSEPLFKSESLKNSLQQIDPSCVIVQNKLFDTRASDLKKLLRVFQNECSACVCTRFVTTSFSTIVRDSHTGRFHKFCQTNQSVGNRTLPPLVEVDANLYGFQYKSLQNAVAEVLFETENNIDIKKVVEKMVANGKIVNALAM